MLGLTDHWIRLDRRGLLILGLVALAYLGTGWLCLRLNAMIDGNVTLIWIPTAIALASAMRWGPWTALAVAVAAFANTALTGAPLLFALATAIGNPIPALVCIIVFRLFSRFSARLDSAFSMIILLAAIGVSHLFSAVVGAFGLVQTGMIPVEIAAEVTFAWWAGDAVGAMLFGPALITATLWRTIPWNATRVVEALVLSFAIFAVSYSPALDWAMARADYPLYLTLPLMIWAAISFGQMGGAGALALKSLVTFGTALAGLGPFAITSPDFSIYYMNGYLVISGFVALMLGAVWTERSGSLLGLRIFRQAVESAPLSVVITDEMGHIRYVNPGFEKMMGFSGEDVLQKNPKLWQSGETPNATYQDLWQTINAQQPWYGELKNKTADGEDVWQRLAIAPIVGPLGETQRFVCIQEDITQQRDYQDLLKYMARHDGLTDLPTKQEGHRMVTNLIAEAHAENQGVAIVFFDLDSFKKINDSFGHAVGDQVLAETAKRIKQEAEGCVVARFGGDEFIMALKSLNPEAAGRDLTKRLRASLNQPFTLRGSDIHLDLSVGMALYPDHGATADALLAAADLAMSRAKSDGGGTVALFTPEDEAKARRRHIVEDALKASIQSNKDFYLQYQPKICLKTGRVHGVEALIRWETDRLGRVSPAEFVPIAEQTDLILDITHWVFRQVVKDMPSLLDGRDDDFRVSINISAKHFDKGLLLADLIRLRDRDRIALNRLELEVTERLLIKQGEGDAKQTMERARALGVTFSIDDFGTGYSALAYLTAYPIDVVKIDRAFVAEVDWDDQQERLLASMLSMAQVLKLKTVAEGAETQETVSTLINYGCDQVQGYYFAKPMPLEELIKIDSQGGAFDLPSRVA